MAIEAVFRLFPVVGIYALALLLLAPLVVLVVFAMMPAGDYFAHISQTVLPVYITNSVWLMLGVGVGTLLWGTLTAWLVSVYEFWGRKWLACLLFLPMAVPAYVAAFVYGGVFEFAVPVQTSLREWFAWQKGDYYFPPVRSLGGAVWVMSFVLYPYVYMLARVAFANGRDMTIIARNLGISGRALFWRVGLPCARPALAAGVALALMEALSDFGAVQYLAVDTFTTGIYRSWLGMNNLAAASKLAVLLMCFVMIVLLLEKYSRKAAKYAPPTACGGVAWRIKLGGFSTLLVWVVCAVPVGFGALLPIGQLLVWAFDTAPQMINAAYFDYVRNTLVVSALAAVIAMGVALIFAYRLRESRDVLLRASAMGYAVPGSVVAVGVLVMLGYSDHVINAIGEQMFGVAPGLILSGTLVALVFAYVFRFLAVSLHSVEAGFAGVPRYFDWAAAVLGKNKWQCLAHVHVPQIKGSLLVACLLVFVEAIKELPATLIIRPFNFETLATATYQLAADERLADCASLALAIVLVAMVPMMVVSYRVSAND